MPRSVPNVAPHPRALLGPFPNSIRGYRIRAGLTQEELADRVGLQDRVTLSIWELGWRMPKLSNALRLARELGTLVESLYWPAYAPKSPRPRGRFDHDFSQRWGRMDPAAKLRTRYRRATKRVRFSAQLRLYRSVAREIRACRLRADLTPEQLGERLGVSSATVRRIEQDDYHHGNALSTVLEIAAALNLEVRVRLVRLRR